MRPDALTLVEIADLLDAAYHADRNPEAQGPIPETRAALADYLGCHPETRAGVWSIWQPQLLAAGEDADAAEYWLDAEFIEPCHEEARQESGGGGSAREVSQAAEAQGSGVSRVITKARVPFD
ncbi:hypothetical protein [Deinococcus multiflagellatus]|uniref:Uncharacterized protein n=1 Tax=Deinococcus multiflagellatus TaxID=1656887 RepID=A0ABW1ZKF5_9DEIO|nr:hypothetical protein [Deinococcus multiflagellatus]MBZ9714613.1 hypothetical protein [Deinococcus multiflagellatus]